jgi:hypothetical protein
MIPKVALLVPFLATILLLSTIVQSSQIRIDSDGGYTGIVVKIGKEVPEEKCPELLSNLKVSYY